MRVADPAGPLAEGGGAGVLQGCGPFCNRDDLCAEQAHPVDIERLAYGILFSHEYHAFHSHERRGSRGGYAVLSGAGFGNQACLSHFFGQQRLAQHIVNLVGPGMVEVLALEIDRTAQAPGAFFSAKYSLEGRPAYSFSRVVNSD